jgi:hypothetical protein
VSIELQIVYIDIIFCRMEPLFLRNYSRIAPLQIQAYNAATRVDYKDMPLEPLVPEITSGGNAGNSSRREGMEELEADPSSNTPTKSMEI